MILAKEKEKENIAEYILYMWQMEDLIRGCNLQLNQILDRVFSGNESDDQRREYTLWFSDLIEEMKRDDLAASGHLKGVKTYMTSMEKLHKSLMTVYQDEAYVNLYKRATPFITDLKAKSGNADLAETELCLIGLYGLLILKMKGKDISEETQEAMKEISTMMAYLAGAFNKLKNGELKLPSRMSN